ncbi:hypothetical protein [Haloferula rosea]|uniref:Uncharacterized protein n=1 Tax=Haloferula rosea TaxID=490093 RepID=A0A934R989_9BACT|nr:hypothetical protein [Haloferula rosea]MBK1826687.1 hypothetical protein [Haloferula rosea]
MIRPWYRSRLFWLANFGLMFLLWCWWDSMQHGTWVGLRKDATPSGVSGFYLTSGFSELSFNSYDDPFVPSGSPPLEFGRFSIASFLQGSEAHAEFLGRWENWFRPAMGRTPYGSVDPFASPGSPPIDPYLAYWLLVLGYLVACSVLLVAWQRWKRKRQLRHQEAVEADE